MQDFLENVSRYPRYLIALGLGIFWNFLEPLIPLLRRPVTGVALVGGFVSTLVFLSLTLRAMLGTTG